MWCLKGKDGRHQFSAQSVVQIFLFGPRRRRKRHYFCLAVWVCVCVFSREVIRNVKVVLQTLVARKIYILVEWSWEKMAWMNLVLGAATWSRVKRQHLTQVGKNQACFDATKRATLTLFFLSLAIVGLFVSTLCRKDRVAKTWKNRPKSERKESIYCSRFGPLSPPFGNVWG